MATTQNYTIYERFVLLRRRTGIKTLGPGFYGYKYAYGLKPLPL